MTLEQLEKKIDALRLGVGGYHSAVVYRYSALDARLDAAMIDSEIIKAKLEALDAKVSLILAHLEGIRAAWDAYKELKP